MTGDGVVCLIPCYEAVPPPALLDGVLRHVEAVVIVDDGSSAPVAAELREVARRSGAYHVRLTPNAGKGTALRVGLRFLRRRHAALRAVIVVDADGQHPPDAIPAFLDAADSAELVIGDRLGDRARIPVVRRTTNRLSQALLQLTTRRAVGDTQSGMRLLRGRALAVSRFPDGRYEAETVHLKLCLRAGVSVRCDPHTGRLCGRAQPLPRSARRPPRAARPRDAAAAPSRSCDGRATRHCRTARRGTGKRSGRRGRSTPRAAAPCGGLLPP